MQALQQENAQLMARIAEMQAERQPTEEYTEAMNKAIADAAKAENERDELKQKNEQLEIQNKRLDIQVWACAREIWSLSARMTMNGMQEGRGCMAQLLDSGWLPSSEN
jgi:predicted  nucleic acid-binding Zn-ribbon protein